MAVSDNFLFADSQIDQKFRMTAEILEQFVANRSQVMSIAYLADHTGHSVREITQVCKKLQVAGLVKSSKNSSKVWMLVCDPNTITLEDVYRGVIANSRPFHDNANPQPENSRGVDLLIMQATMEVNQSIFKHLRQFSLGRPRHSHFSNSRR
jgi:DNA-binding IscR family transcriptional regulator